MTKKYKISYNYKQSGGVEFLGLTAKLAVAGYELRELFDNYWWLTLTDNLLTSKGFECYYYNKSLNFEFDFKQELKDLIGLLKDSKEIKKKEIEDIFKLTIIFLQGLNEKNYVTSDNISNCNLFKMLVDKYKQKYKIDSFKEKEKKIWQEVFNNEDGFINKITLPTEKMIIEGIYNFTPLKFRKKHIYLEQQITNIKYTEAFLTNRFNEKKCIVNGKEIFYESFYLGFVNSNEITELKYNEQQQLNKLKPKFKFPNTTDEINMTLSIFDSQIQNLKTIKSCTELNNVKSQTDKLHIPIIDKNKKIVIHCNGNIMKKSYCSRGITVLCKNDNGEKYFTNKAIKLNFVDFSPDAKHDSSPFKHPVNYLRNQNKLFKLYLDKEIDIQQINSSNLKDILQYIRNKNLFFLDANNGDLINVINEEFKIRKFFCEKINELLEEESITINVNKIITDNLPKDFAR